LSALAAIGAALTVTLRAGGGLIGLLVLPLTGPVLIFGTRAMDLAIHGESTAGALYLLAALTAFCMSLAPLAAAAAIRVNLE
jgi:heme exporter protein B